MTTDEYLAFAAIAVAPFLFVWLLAISFKPFEQVLSMSIAGPKTWRGCFGPRES